MKFKILFSSLSVLIGTIVYFSLSFISLSLYPGNFSIINDLWTHLRWFSYNPEGALIFRIANLTYGLSVAIFFINFNKWSVKFKERRVLIIICQILGFIISILLILTELLADIGNSYTILSGLSLLLIIVLLIILPLSIYHHPKFWKILIVFFLINIGFNSYLLYLGITNSLIVEFRIIDFLVSTLSQVSICLLSLNMLRLDK